MQNALPYDLLRYADAVILPAACLGMLAVAFLSFRRNDSRFFALSVGVTGFVLGNTLLCTAMSGVHDRYQARITWLVFLTVLLWVLSFRLDKVVCSDSHGREKV